jgi:hypothetical protein
LVLDVARARAHVVALERFDDVGERDPIAHERHRVGLDVVLLDVAADRVDSSHALDAAKLGANEPVLNRSQVGRALDVGAERLALEG